MIKQVLFSFSMFATASLQAQTVPHNPAQYNVNGVVWQQQSGEYKALCYQAFNLARFTLQDILHTNKDSMPLAIVSDVDETVLDNSPDAAHDILFNHTYADSSWKNWVDLAKAPAMPGAKEFFNFAAQHGVQCFYITNRAERDKAATIKNLQLQGFPQADSMHVIMKGNDSNKEPRRLDVAKKYNIVLLLGDNLNDLDEVFYDKPAAERNAVVDKRQSLFGTRYIVLPNATYGDWESALWKGEKLSDDKKTRDEQKDQIKWKSLIGY